jgi:hypothetical protein
MRSPADDRLRRGEDRLTPNPIFTCLDATACQHVDLTAQEVLQLAL